jgi:hypothetical protein
LIPALSDIFESWVYEVETLMVMYVREERSMNREIYEIAIRPASVTWGVGTLFVCLIEWNKHNCASYVAMVPPR